MVEMTVKLVSPEGVLFQGPFTALNLPAYDGLMGILPGHAPFVGRLGIGPMRIEHSGKSETFGLYGGFLQVTPGRVDVVVDRADRPADLDPEECQRELEALLAPRRMDVDAFEDELIKRRIAAMRLALARL